MTAENTPAANTSTASPQVGQVAIVHGTVQAQSPDGSIRVLEAGSPVYANERILTGADGAVTIIFADPDQTRLDLGRMSDLLLDEGNLPRTTEEELAKAQKEADEIKEGLLSGELDPDTQLEDPAAGHGGTQPTQDTEGSTTAVAFELSKDETTPDSGAETTGIDIEFLPAEEDEKDTSTDLDKPPLQAPISPAAFTGQQATTATAVTTMTEPGDTTIPEAGEFSATLDEAHLADGTRAGQGLLNENGQLYFKGTFNDLQIDFNDEPGGTISFGTLSLAIDGTGDSITIAGQYGELTVYDNGTWVYTLTDNTAHDGKGLTGVDDALPEKFPFTVTDTGGDAAYGALNLQIYDDGPVISGEPLTAVTSEDGLQSSLGDASDGLGGGFTQAAIDLSSLTNTGADAPGIYIITEPPANFVTGLTSKGLPVQYNVEGSTLTASTANNVIFTLEVDPISGVATFNLYDQLDHSGGGDNELLSITNLGQFVQIYDTDGDSANFDGFMTIQVENDVPQIQGAPILGQVAEDGLSIPEDNADGIGEGITEIELQLNSIVEAGADEELVYGFRPLPENFDTGLTSQGVPITYSASSNTLTASAGGTTVFTVTIDPFTGAATFNLDGAVDHGGVGDNEVLTISNIGQFIVAVDEDGDSVNFDGYINIEVENDVPRLAETALTGTVYEDGLELPDDSSEGIGGGETVVQFNLADSIESGADQRLSYSLEPPQPDYNTGLTSGGTAVTYSVSGNTLTAMAGPNIVFTLSVDPVSGIAEFDLQDQLDHTGVGDYEIITISHLGDFIIATDADGDSLSFEGVVQVQVENDIPEITQTALTATVFEDGLHTPVDGSNGVGGGATEVQLDLASITESGADETVTYTLTEPAEGFDTGLTSNGVAVTYSVSGNTLTASAGEQTVFTFEIEPDSGIATFNLDAQIDHAGTGDDELLAIGNLGQFVQVTDADGDMLDFTDLITVQVENDIPSITRTGHTATVFEDGLHTPQDSSDGIGGGATEVQFDLASITESGADETVTYSLTAPPDDFDTGLFSAGVAVTYSVSGNILTASAGPQTVFTLEVDQDTGIATFNLDDQLDHTGLGDSEILNIENLGQFVQVTDADGDTVNFNNLLNVEVENDVPVISGTPLTLKVFEDGLQTPGDSSDGIGGGATQIEFQLGDIIDAGADEEIIFSLTEPPTGFSSFLTSSGVDVEYSVNGNTLTASAGETTVFTLEVDPADGKAIFNLEDQLDHQGLGDSEIINITNLGQFIQVTDADGDALNFSGFVNLQVENDIPQLTDASLIETVYEDGLAAPDDASEGVGGGETTVQVNLANAVESGADETLSYSLNQPPDNFNSGITSRNTPVSYSVSGNTLTATAGSIVVFTFMIDPATGMAEFDLNDQLDHQGAGDSEILSISNLGQFVQATDSDGDSLNLANTFTIQVQNDIPTVGDTTFAATLFEDGLATPDQLSEGVGGGAIEAQFNLAGATETGADEDISFRIATPPDHFDSGLTSKGVDVEYSVVGNTLVATAGAETVFTFSVNANTGASTFKLNDQLDHRGVGDDELLTISNLGQFVEVVDSDGDAVNFSGLININIENDVPVITGGPVVQTVYEDGLSRPEDASEGIGGGMTEVEFNLSDFVESGADENITYGFADPSGFDTGLTSKGIYVNYSVQGDALIASAGETTVFTVTMDPASGVATFNLNDQLDHQGLGDAEMLTIDNLGQFMTATDADGDSVDFGGRISIQVENDVPQVIETAQFFFVSEYAGYNSVIGTYELDENGNPTNPQIIIDSTNSLANFSQAGITHFGGQYTQGVQLGSYEEGTKMFMIADGARASSPVTDTSALSFRPSGDEDPADGPAFILQIETSPGVFEDVDPARGIYFMDSYLDTNDPGRFAGGTAPDDATHFTDQWANSPWPDRFINSVPEFGGEVRIEDTNFGDGDFDDTVLRVEKGAVVSESGLKKGTGKDPDADAVATGNFFEASAAGIQFVPGADESLSLDITSNGIYTPAGWTNQVSYDHQVVITQGAARSSFEEYQSEAGTLKIWNNGDWEYTLERAVDHPDTDKGAGDKRDGDYDRYAADQVQDVFGIVATDADGDAVTTNFIVNINDDGAEAFNDSGAAFGYDSYINTGDTPPPVTFNVLRNDTGADGLTLVEATLQGDPGVGTVEIVNNKIVFTPGPDFHGEVKIDYSMVDKDNEGTDYGPTADATLTVTERFLKVGTNIDDGPTSTEDYTAGVGSGTITGGGAADILIGDSGGVGITQGSLNLLVIMDTSGSMSSNNRQQLMEDAVNRLMDNLADGRIDNVRVHLTEYNYDSDTVGKGTSYAGTYDLIIDGVKQDFSEAQQEVSALRAGGMTNYESGLQQGLDWIYTDAGPSFTGSRIRAEADGGPLEDAANLTIFMTDGYPNTYITDSGSSTYGSSSASMGQIIGADGTNEVQALQDWGVLRAVGIELNTQWDATALDRLNAIDENSDAINIPANQLVDALPDLVAESFLLDVGSDEIVGGGGNDLIYGDSLFTDNVIQNLIDDGTIKDPDYDTGLSDGAGWAVFEALENDPDISWSRTNTINYILANAEALGATSRDGDGNPRFGGDDLLFGETGKDKIFGQEGDDVIEGGRGHDTIHGDIGDDTISGDTGKDIVFGGEGDDLLTGGKHDDQIDGGLGDDDIFGGEGNDFLVGAIGEDEIYGEDGSDEIYGFEGDDKLYGGDDQDTIHGEGGRDYLEGGGGDDILEGGTGEDEIHGDAGSDTILGGEGDDHLVGGTGDDTILGQSGSDLIFGSEDDDLLLGGTEADEIYGESGNDELQGQEGDDTLVGGADNDVIFGGEGDDTIEGGEGQDQIVGGTGQDQIDGGEGDDILVGDAVEIDLPESGDSDIIDDGSADTITGGEGTDTTGDKNLDDTVTDQDVGESTEEDLDNLIPPTEPV